MSNQGKQRYYPLPGFGNVGSAALFCRAFDEVRHALHYIGLKVYPAQSLPAPPRNMLKQAIVAAASEKAAAELVKSFAPARYLTEHLHEVPVFVLPCIEGRATNQSALEQASLWGGIWPATWSFMLAARSRGLGTVLTTLHLAFEREAAGILGIPYEQVMQVGLVPVAYTLGTAFKPAARKPLDTVVHWERWAPMS